MEKKVSSIYRKSATGITKKWNDFMSSSSANIEKYQAAYNEAVSTGDKKLIESTQKTLQNAIKQQTLGNSYYKSMIDDVTTKLSQVNETALAYVNNQMPSVYTKNFNFMSNDMKVLTSESGIRFNIVDEHVVSRRIKDGDITLPKKKVDVPKDKRWNTKQLNSSVLQGILQGESMDEIAKRISPIVDNNQASAIRNARTMVTQSENQGRLDRYKDLAARGAIIKKVWMATGDDRTRGWHLTMDGQEKDLDEPFVDGLGNELSMPGDSKAKGITVYNCRCTTRSHIIGFRKADGSVSMINYDYSQDEPSLHEQEIARERSNRTASASASKSSNTVFGVDINEKHYEVFSEGIRSKLDELAEMISRREYPSFDELFDLYSEAKTPEDKLLLKFLNDSQTYVQSYKDFSDDVKKQYAEIFSVLNTPSDDVLFRGESGSWVEHYGGFEKGEIISFDSISFTTPNNTEAMSNYDVLFEFEKGTPSIYTANQAWEDVLILGNFEIISVETLANGQKHVVLRYVRR